MQTSCSDEEKPTLPGFTRHTHTGDEEGNHKFPDPFSFFFFFIRKETLGINKSVTQQN